MQKIKFQGEEYVLIGGAIAMEDQYRHGRLSYAHLIDGKIYRFGEMIGTGDDIEYLDEEVEIEVADDAWANILNAVDDMLR